MAHKEDMEALAVALGETEGNKIESRAHLAHRLDQLKVLEDSNVLFGIFMVRTKRRVEDDEGILFFVTGELAIQRPSDARWLRTQVNNVFVDEKTFAKFEIDQPYHLFLNPNKVEP